MSEFRSLTFDDSGPSHFLNALRNQFKDSIGLLKGSSRGDSIGYYIEIAFNNLDQQKQALQKQFIVQNQEIRLQRPIDNKRSHICRLDIFDMPFEDSVTIYYNRIEQAFKKFGYILGVCLHYTGTGNRLAGNTYVIIESNESYKK